MFALKTSYLDSLAIWYKNIDANKHLISSLKHTLIEIDFYLQVSCRRPRSDFLALQSRIHIFNCDKFQLFWDHIILRFSYSNVETYPILCIVII